MIWENVASCLKKSVDWKHSTHAYCSFDAQYSRCRRLKERKKGSSLKRWLMRRLQSHWRLPGDSFEGVDGLNGCERASGSERDGVGVAAGWARAREPAARTAFSPARTARSPHSLSPHFWNGWNLHNFLVNLFTQEVWNFIQAFCACFFDKKIRQCWTINLIYSLTHLSY